MPSSALATVTRVWLLLLVASAASLWLGTGGSAADQSHTVAILGVLAIAFAKIWLIVRYFMEVRFAPVWLRTVTNAWVAGVFVALAVLYLMSGHQRG